MMLLRSFVLLLLWGLLTGCAGVSQFVPADLLAPDSDQQLVDPQHTLLIIYNHGSQPEFDRDYCVPNGWTTPGVIRSLSGHLINGYQVRVFGLCSNGGIGSYNHRVRSGEPKVMKRVRKIEETVREFQAQGVAPERIFLAGHSAGGWASLLVKQRGEVALNGVIAFAPAFAGPRATRSPGWQALRAAQIDDLKQAGAIPALVYGVEEDPFESAKALTFLSAIPGVELQRMSANGECHSRDPHRLAFSRCFARQQMAAIEAFIRRRLGASQAGL